MAGSFKSMVWDYYLPTDMHEASKVIRYIKQQESDYEYYSISYEHITGFSGKT